MDIAFTDDFDFAVDNGDLVISDGFLVKVAHALFRDARAPASVLQPGEDPRGHWATKLVTVGLDANAPDGSFLWRMMRDALTPSKPTEVARELERACGFMITATEGPAAPVVGVTASATKTKGQRGRIDALLTFALNQGQPPRRVALTYDTDAGVYRLQEV